MQKIQNKNDYNIHLAENNNVNILQGNMIEVLEVFSEGSTVLFS